MTIVVLDTNVLASGILGLANPASTPGAILRAWRAAAFELATSDHIIDETARALADPCFQRRLTGEQIRRAQAALERRATLVTLTVEVHGVATHPEDDLVLATAVSARAQYLVTGDKKLQALGAYRSVAILSPRQFADVLAAEQPPLP